MDAVQYLKNETRMCSNGANCEGCHFGKARDDFGLSDCTSLVRERPDIAVLIVEEWSKANPAQTNADKFKEVFGWVGIDDLVEEDEYGCINAVPSSWWREEYKAPKEE